MNHDISKPIVPWASPGTTPVNGSPENISTQAHTSIVSQSQPNNPPPSSVVTYHISTTPPADYEPNTTNNDTVFVNPPGLVVVHHEDSTNYVLDQYCCPVQETFVSPEEVCKYNRQCVVAKTKILIQGENLPNLSPTVYRNYRHSSKSISYTTMDARLVSCFNKLCKSTNTKSPKRFHYVCYKHMMATKANETMDVLEIETVNDKITDEVVDKTNLPAILDTLKNDDKRLIFPICGKRCYNSIVHKRNKENTGSKDESEYSQAQSWDNDGDEKVKSSIEVLINWMTTEENASSYFGGLDVEGRTSANRKETYHHLIRDLIKEENDDNSSYNLGSQKLKKNDKVIKSPKRKSTKSKNNRYTPLEAKKMQKTLLSKNKKKSIVKKNGKYRSSSYVSLENDNRDLLIETRKTKMIFEKEKHMDMKRLENEKMNIERERLNMEKDTIKLRHEHMMTQNNLERSKIALLRLEMFKERQEIKKKYPEVTDEMLNEQFPYPD